MKLDYQERIKNANIFDVVRIVIESLLHKTILFRSILEQLSNTSLFLIHLLIMQKEISILDK